MLGSRHGLGESVPAGQWIPGRALVDGQVAAVGDVPVGCSCHLVAMSDERGDLQIGEPVEIGPQGRDDPLDDRVQGMGILHRIDHLRDRGEEKSVLVAEVLPFELPDAVPEDV